MMVVAGIVYFDGQKVSRNGGLAQLVERVLSMHEVGRSIRPFSIGYLLFRHSHIASTTTFIALTTLGLELPAWRAAWLLGCMVGLGHNCTCIGGIARQITIVGFRN